MGKLEIQSESHFRKSKSKVDDPPLPQIATNAEIDSFFEKLVFVVDTPNENEFDKILDTYCVGKYYNARDSGSQSERISKQMLDWFKKSEKESEWLTQEDGKKMLLSGVSRISIEYQKELRKDLEFNSEAIQWMVEKLSSLLDSSENVLHIVTEWTKFTAAKVIALIKTMPE